MSEQTFFQYEDVHVTNARFINGGQTYAMSNVTSVKTSEDKPKRFWGVVVLLIGVVMLANQPVVGVLIAAVAALYLYKQKTTYHIMLATAGGEVSALRTYQREYVEKVVAALNQAIIARG